MAATVTIVKGDREMTVSPERAANLAGRGWTVKPAPAKYAAPVTRPRA